MQVLEDLMFFDHYQERFYVRRWNEAIVYRYCLLVPMEIGNQVGISILDPAGFELFLEGCYGCQFEAVADALVAGIKAVNHYIQEALHHNSTGASHS